MNVFFDLDGTLTDPREGIVACIEHALDALAVEIHSSVRLESFIGPPLRDTFRHLCGDDLADEGVRLYRERFTRIGLYENRLHEGILDCLQRLEETGCQSYVVTSKPTVFATRIVEHFKIRGYFSAVYGSHLDGSLSDKAALLAHVLEREGIDAPDAVMIGDRKYDVAGAQHHGIRSIGVLWGYGSEQELRESGADVICASPVHLFEHILGRPTRALVRVVLERDP